MLAGKFMNNDLIDRAELWMDLLGRPLYPREKWRALYRLYRIAIGNRSSNVTQFAAAQCLSVLLRTDEEAMEMLDLLEGPGDHLVFNRDLPLALRRWRSRKQPSRDPLRLSQRRGP